LFVFYYLDNYLDLFDLIYFLFTFNSYSDGFEF